MRVRVRVRARVGARVSGYLVELDRAARDDVAALSLTPPRLKRVGG